MSRRPLVTVPALTLADLLLWHWSLTAHHQILAIVAGLTLPPLLVASMWLLALAVVRLLAQGVRGPLIRVSRTRALRARARRGSRTGARASRTGASTPAPQTAVASPATLATPRPVARPTAARPAQVPVASADRERPPRKLAA